MCETDGRERCGGTNTRLAVRSGEEMAVTRSLLEVGGDVEADRELILEDARSMRDAIWRMGQPAQDAAARLDERIEAEKLDGRAEGAEARDVVLQDLLVRI
jgi:hypothetical protein